MKQLLIASLILTAIPLIGNGKAPQANGNVSANAKVAGPESGHADLGLANASATPAKASSAAAADVKAASAAAHGQPTLEADQKTNAPQINSARDEVRQFTLENQQLNELLIRNLVKDLEKHGPFHVDEENFFKKRVRLAQQANLHVAASYWSQRAPYFGSEWQQFQKKLDANCQSTKSLAQLSLTKQAELAANAGLLLVAQFFMDQKQQLARVMDNLHGTYGGQVSTLLLMGKVNMHRAAAYLEDLREEGRLNISGTCVFKPRAQASPAAAAAAAPLPGNNKS